MYQSHVMPKRNILLSPLLVDGLHTIIQTFTFVKNLKVAIGSVGIASLHHLVLCNYSLQVIIMVLER